MWKKIDNTNYSVSINGEVRNDKTNRILKQTLNSRYLKVSLGKKREGMSVHRLVAEYFCDNPLQYKCVNHIDGDKLNNTSKNLEWCTHSQNSLHKTRILGKSIGESHYRSFLSDKDVINVIALRQQGKSLKCIAEIYKCSTTSISNMITGKSRSNSTKITYTKKKYIDPNKIVELFNKGYKQYKIAEALNLSNGTITYHLKKLKMKRIKILD